MKIEIGPFLREDEKPNNNLYGLFYTAMGKLVCGKIAGEETNELGQRVLNIHYKMNGIVTNSIVRKTRVSQHIDFRRMFPYGNRIALT